MVFQTIDHLPKSDFNVFLLRQDMDKINVLKLIKQKFKRPLIQTLDHITLGQACTAFEAVSNLKRNSYFLNNHILFAPCDVGVMYNQKLYTNLLNDKDVDIIVWTSNKYNEAKLKPNMYGWVKSKNNLITDVLVKKTKKFY